MQTQVNTVTTDVYKVDIDTAGGVIRRLELLKYRDKVDQTKNQVLFQANGPRVYLAQTGLTGASAAGVLPNHNTPFTVRPGPRTLDSNNQVQVVLDAEQGGVRLTKTFTFKADKAGVFPYYCTNFCSALHQEMQGYLIVKKRG